MQKKRSDKKRSDKKHWDNSVMTTALCSVFWLSNRSHLPDYIVSQMHIAQCDREGVRSAGICFLSIQQVSAYRPGPVSQAQLKSKLLCWVISGSEALWFVTVAG